jgi:hypothetical protein
MLIFFRGPFAYFFFLGLSFWPKQRDRLKYWNFSVFRFCFFKVLTIETSYCCLNYCCKYYFPPKMYVAMLHPPPPSCLQLFLTPNFFFFVLETAEHVPLSHWQVTVSRSFSLNFPFNSPKLNSNLFPSFQYKDWNRVVISRQSPFH